MSLFLRTIGMACLVVAASEMTGWSQRVITVSRRPAATALPSMTATPIGAECLITVLPSAEANDPIITIADVARITGGTAALQQRIGQLDLVEFGSHLDSLPVSAELVRMRLRVDGLESRVTGAESSIVRRADEVPLDDAVLSTCRLEFAAALGISETQLVVDLAQPLPKLSEILRGTNVDAAAAYVEPQMPDRVRLGRQRIPLHVYSGDRLVKVVNATVQARIERTFVMTRRPIEKDQLIQADDLREETRLVTQLTDGNSLEDFVGRTLNRAMPAGLEMRTTYLASKPEATLGPVVVKRRDVVRIVAKKGKLTVIVNNGECMQDGRMGDLIRVKNVSTNKILVGQVVNGREVHIRF
ncbi:MAG: flagellar basal body P-ring formation chaperone FlgA [Pirellulaceae bacterium]